MTMANELNGWRFSFDASGYWASGGGERFGPYDTPQDLRHFAKKNQCPKRRGREKPIVINTVDR